MFFNKLIIIQIQPFIYFLAGVGIWAFLYRKSKVPLKENKEFMKRISFTLTIIIYVLQPGLVKNIFDLYNCQNFGSINEPDLYLKEDTAVKCGSLSHVVWVVALGIPCLILCNFSFLTYIRVYLSFLLDV